MRLSDASNIPFSVEGGSPVVIEIIVSGARGPKGDQGDKGDAGDGQSGGGGGGNSDAAFEYEPPSALAIWTITHNMDKYPSVTVVNTLGEVVMPQIEYLSRDIVQITFVYATTGKAYLN